MNKKQVIIYIIILVVVSSIVGIVSYNIGVNSKDINKSNSIVKESNNNSSKENEKKIITQEELKQYTTQVNITTDNWKDYIDVKDFEKETKDQFEEITGSVKGNNFILKDNLYGSVLIEYNIKNSANERKRTITINNNTKVDDEAIGAGFVNNNTNNGSIKNYDYTVNKDDIICSRIKGNLYVIDFPDNMWQKDVEGKEYIVIETSEQYRKNSAGENEYIYIYKDTYLEDLGRMVQVENGN